MIGLTLINTLTGANPALYGSVHTLLPLAESATSRTHVFAGSEATGVVTSYRVTEDGPIDAPSTVTVSTAAPVYRIADMVLVDSAAPRILVSAVEMQQITAFSVSPSGTLSNQSKFTSLAAPVTEMEKVQVAGHEFVATDTRDSSGLQIYEWTAADRLELRGSMGDHDKAALGNVTDMARVQVGPDEFLLVGSSADEAVSTVRIGTDGTAEVRDTLCDKDGLWVAGLSDVASVTAHGESFAVVAGTLSSSLTLIRVNSLGRMFVEDHVTDTLDTRFARAGAVASFEVEDRGFVVAGGADDGLSLLEIMPDRSFLSHGVLENEAGGALEDIAALATLRIGGEVQVIAAGQPGLTLATMDTGQIGGTMTGGNGGEKITGGGQDDLIWGMGGNDTLSGGAGDDVLSGGAGRDVLSGGAGADVFIFDADRNQDTVTDFELGVDRLDLSRWGRLYDAGSLNISERGTGADIYFRDFSLRLIAHDQQTIHASDLTNDSFLF